MVTAIELFEPTNAKALWMVIEWNYLLLILLYFSVQMTNLLHRNEKFGTVRNKCSIIPLSSSLHFVTRVRRSRFVRLSWFSCSLCWQQHPYCERPIRLVYPHSFCKHRSSSRPTNKNLVDLGLEIETTPSPQPFTIRHMFIWSSVTMNDTITFQNIDFFSWITLYISSNLTTYYYCLHHFKKSVRVRECLFHFVNMLLFCSEDLVAFRPTPKLEDHSFSSVHTCLKAIITLYNFKTFVFVMDFLRPHNELGTQY